MHSHTSNKQTILQCVQQNGGKLLEKINQASKPMGRLLPLQAAVVNPCLGLQNRENALKFIARQFFPSSEKARVSSAALMGLLEVAHV